MIVKYCDFCGLKDNVVTTAVIIANQITWDACGVCRDKVKASIVKQLLKPGDKPHD